MATGPSRVELGVLAAALAGAWLAVDLAFPQLIGSGEPGAFTRGIIHSTILIGLWLGLARTDFTPRVRALKWAAIATPYTLWMLLTWTLAAHEVFRPVARNDRIPLLPLAIFVPIGLGALMATRSRRIGALLDAVLDAMPASWLIGVQLYRVLGVMFLASWVRGAIPALFALPAGIGDVIVGVLALPAASLASAATPRGYAAARTWNLLGLTDLALAILTATVTFRVRIHAFGLDHPDSQLGVFPMVMIPAFAVPNSILLHLLSIRQLRRLHSPASVGAAVFSSDSRPGR